MDSYYLSEKADNRYKNKEARIIVNLESIQAESGEMKAIWGKNEKDLGITYQPCTCEVVTSVIFDKNHKLIIGGEKTAQTQQKESGADTEASYQLCKD